MDEKETKKEEENKEIKNNDSLGKFLLPEKSLDKLYKKTLVLDLDETLAHGQSIPFSSTKHQKTLQCILNNTNTTIYFKTRPGVKEFLRKMSKLYEIVIFTASVEEYAKPLIDIIDSKNLCSHKLYREQCTFRDSAYIKDLKRLGRDLKDVIILDNSPNSYSLNKENGIPITTWFDDEDDRELYNIIQILDFLSEVDDVRFFIPKFVIGNEISYFASVDIMRKFKNKFLKNNNISAINFHPFTDDSEINNNQLTDINSHSILAENIINREENVKETEQTNKSNIDMEKKEQDLLNVSEHFFDDIMLNENINKTDLNINIDEDINLSKYEEVEKVNNNNFKNKIVKKDIKIAIDTESTKELNKTKENKEKNIKDNKEKTKKKTTKNKTNKNANTNSSKNVDKTNKNKTKNKTKAKGSNNNNTRKIRHNKSSSCGNNIISDFNLLIANNKSKKDSLNNRNKYNMTFANIKSKTVKRPKKVGLEEKQKKKFYHPRNIITDFKPLKTLNNSVSNIVKNKNKPNLNIISNTPKKIKKSVKNKLKNRILTHISKSKEKKEKSKEKLKDDSLLNETGKNNNKQNNNIITEINRKELIKHRKKTPFRVHPKKEKKNNTNINNISLKNKKEEEKDNKTINNIKIDKNKRENSSLIKEKNNEIKNNKIIINNHKAAKSVKQIFVNKKIENRLPWGWGGYTLKLSDIDNLFNYNVESREIRIAKININSYKRAKSCKPIKKEKNKTNKDSKNINTKRKEGLSSSNSANNITFSKTDKKKE